jgi:chromosome partitioning protein
MYGIAITNQKGGVGKTTTTITLAHAFAQRGYRVLVIDLDGQGNSADVLGLPKNTNRDLYNFLINNAGRDAITTTGRPNLDIVLSNHRTIEAKQILIGRPFREQALKNAVGQLERDYDIAFYDVAPGLDILQVAAFVASTHFLIPVMLDHLAVVGASEALTSAFALKQQGGLTARFLGIIPTFWERTTKESDQQLRTLVKKFKQHLWPVIPIDVKAREATSHGLTLWEHAPNCRALDGVELRNGKVVGGYKAIVNLLEKELRL